MNISSTESGNDADCVDIYLPENIVSIMIIIACIQAETNYY